MKRVVSVMLALLFVATLCSAQGVRNSSLATVTPEGKTGLGNVGVYGLDNTGNPGYIELIGATQTGSGLGNVAEPIHYFLWVDFNGDLCISSILFLMGIGLEKNRLAMLVDFIWMRLVQRSVVNRK